MMFISKTSIRQNLAAVFIACLLMTGLVSCGGGSGGSPANYVSINTLDGVTGVPVDSTFVYTFSQAVNSTTVDASSYFILPTPVQAAAMTKAALDPAICNPAGALPALINCISFNECTIDPAENLMPGMSYTACLNTGIEYFNGGSFQGFMATFTSAGTAPAAPGNFGVTIGDAQQQLVITWDNVDGATSYNLYWGTAAGVTPASGTKIEGATSPYTHDGLTNGTRYYYVATAVSDSLESSPSDEANGVPQINPVGQLDTTFNATGYMQYGTSISWGSGAAVDSSDRVLTAGILIEGAESYNMALWRYDANGAPDTTFGGGDGLVTSHNAAGGNDRDWGSDVAIDSSGRILVTGYSHNTSAKYDMVIWRYDTNGTLDSTFGTNGIVTYDRGVGGNNFGYAIALDASGRILVAGSAAGATTNDDMALWRYTDTGAPDTSFGTNGVVFDHNAAGGAGGDTGYGLTIDSNGLILVTGESANAGGHNDLVVWRYTDSGVLDTSFSGDGVALYDRGDEDSGRGVTTDSNGRVIATGFSNNGADNDLVALRYTNTGEPDTTFSDDGVAIYDNGMNDRGSAVAVDSRGRYVITGSSYFTASASNMIILRYSDDGVLDTTFDTDGVAAFNNGAIVDSRDTGSGVKFDSTGRIVVSGETGAYAAWYMMLWRYE